jgi:hypothetical protein
MQAACWAMKIPQHAALVKDLKRLGFARNEWPDASHIAAFRA